MPGVLTLPDTALTEADLISRAKEFRPEAWDVIYDTYFPKMYTFLYAHVGDRSAAEDLAAEVFEQACRGIHRFQYRGVPFASWLYRIAHNIMVDFHKRRRRTESIDAEPARDLPAAGDLTDTVALRDQLARALRHLTGEQARVLVLRHIEGLDVASTAIILGKKDNAVRALEFRALRALRRLLSREDRGK